MRWILCFIWVSLLCGKPLEVEVSAQSAILMNASTGAILYEKHAHIPAYPASTTKIATALFLLDNKQVALDQSVTVSSEALKIKPPQEKGDFPAYWGEVDGTKMGLVKGEILTVEALLHGMMMISGNDAANVLAESASGSVPKFMEEMNFYLKTLGCLNTQFRNPHGLHHPEHFTTAYDLCLMARKALQFPKFREIVSKLSYTRPKTNKRPEEELRHTNLLLKKSKYYYAKAIGIKTGYHSNAQNSLVAAAENEGRTLVAVLLGCKQRTDRYEDAVRLFEAAFAQALQTRRMFGREHLFHREVEGAGGVLQCSLKSDLSVAFYPAEEPSCKAFVHWEVPPLPISRGQRVGEVRILDERGTVLSRGDLIAKEELKGTLWFSFKQLFK